MYDLFFVLMKLYQLPTSDLLKYLKLEYADSFPDWNVKSGSPENVEIYEKGFALYREIQQALAPIYHKMT